MTAIAWVLAVWGVLIAITVGSFICVIIDRLPLALDTPNEYGDYYDTRPWSEVFGGTSRCSSCGTPVRPRDNIPVVSWLILRGRCRGCAERIPAFHPLVELAVPLVAVGMYLALGNDWLLLPALFLVPAGIAIAVIDLRTLMVPTKLIWPTFLVEVVLCVAIALGQGNPRWLLGGLVGIAVLAGPLFALWWFHPKGMGFGDVRLTVLLGWVVGFFAAASGGSLPVVAMLILLTMALAAAFGIALGLASIGRGRQIPFGPPLVAAAFLAIAFAQPFVEPFI